MGRTVVALLLAGFYVGLCERCPIIIGGFECPEGYKCVDNQCFSSSGQLATSDCTAVSCPSMTRCFKGRCYSTVGLTCNRNVFVSNSTAKSILSECGNKGKCVNGRCVEDRCMGVSCKETELCRDGLCTQLAGTFCFSHFDCGPALECIANRCTVIAVPIDCNCDPGEVCQQGKCIPDSSNSCLCFICNMYADEGACVSVIGRDCSQDPCEGGTICVQGRCSLDPCLNRCPVDHGCRFGECRHLQGILCDNHCPHPYECIDGRCTRNDCAHKVCQLGETCENGFCIKVEERFCTLAIRDCGEHFECDLNKCRDKLQIA
uniref:TIL domain-containing protein n=1 Tax=Ascaris lumbricoides TaxID=6252 RepID=A0A9J2P4T8_ASCLU